MTAHASIAETSAFRGAYAQTALVFQGGGALGAYQAGVYQALAEAGYAPDWLSGISIGAINAAMIAGNEPDMRLPRLCQFWKQSTSSFRWPALDFGDDVRRLFNYASAISSLLSGQPGFFRPRFILPFLQPHGASGALSVYDTSPLRTTLEALVDFDRINSSKTRLSLAPSTFVWATSFISIAQSARSPPPCDGKRGAATGLPADRNRGGVLLGRQSRL
jgi:NTE family protein